MSFVPNLRITDPVKMPDTYPYSDVLFDYASFLRSVQTAGSIAKYDGSDTVAIVGTGAAAIVAAYELQAAGVNVSIFSPDQATNRFGRCYSRDNFSGAESAITEMGAMRFPPSEVALFHYLDMFGIKYTDDFPDPGKVDTLLHAQGKNYHWSAGDPVPSIFENIRKGFDALIANGVVLPDGTSLRAPADIATYLQGMELESAQMAWQAWITAFEPYSFRSALTLIFQQENVNNIPGGYRWTDDDITLFGTLGIGSGGFGPLYSIGFLEMARLFVNQLETNQQFIPGGIASLFSAMLGAITDPNGQTPRASVTKSLITRMAKEKDETFTLTSRGKNVHSGYAAVVFTPSNWSIPINTNLVSSASETLLSEDEKTALRNQHIISSSKLFVITESKFWIENKLPANIQTDSLARGVYCLDYSPGDPSGAGVVLVSYTWQDDSAKQLASPQTSSSADAKKGRLDELVRDINAFLPDFAKHLVPKNGDYEKYVDVVDWILEPNYHGAFKLNLPGQGRETQAAFLDFQKAGTADDTGLYVAGDGSSFYGGWVEGALQTGLNAATAVLTHLGASDFVTPNPMNGIKTAKYDYRTDRS